MTEDLELPGEFNVGDVVGNTYNITGYLGRGAMGHVYHAHHVMLNAQYALKTLSRDRVTDLIWRRFQNEAQAIARLNHPNIVQIYNLGLHDGVLPYYAMDLLIGRDLSQFLQEGGPADETTAAAIFIEVCAGVSFAHKKGIVHRDIKPGNIFLLDQATASGARVKVVDFGIAKLSETKDPANQMLTSVGDVVGTPFYMSPEQTMGERVDPRSDIYSLGCTLFEALTGTVPFRGRNATETMLAHQTDAPPSLNKASGGRDFSPAMEYIVAMALAKKPAERYQTMEQFGRDLTSLVSGQAPVVVSGGAEIEAVAPAPTSPSLMDLAEEVGAETRIGARPATIAQPPAGRTFNPVFIAAACALLCFIGAAVYFCWPRGPADLTVPEVKQETAAAVPAPVVAEAARKADEAEKDVTLEDELTVYDWKKEPFPTHQYPSSELLSSHPFCTRIENNDGKKCRYFDFPKDVTIGIISLDNDSIPDNEKQLYKAQGHFKLPADVWIDFVPTDAAEHCHGAFKRFSKNDIDCIRFEPRYGNDKTLAEATFIPDLQMIDMENCWNFTPACISSLNKFKNLKTFDAAYSSMDGETLSKANFWKGIEDLNMARLAKPKPFLRMLAKCENLDRLTLKETDIGRADFERIAKLDTISYLCLDDSCVSPENLALLVNMESLEELSIQNACLDISCLDVLKRFKKLKRLAMSGKHVSNSDLKKVQRALPHVKVR